MAISSSHGPTPEDASLVPGSELSGPGSDSDLISEIENTVVSKGVLLEAGSAVAGMRPKELGLVLKGQQLDDVLLEEYIGGGGMGAVFRGRDLALDRVVAVKVLATHQAGDEENQRRFEVEARSTARLDHPNIARVYSVGEGLGLRYIVFEHVQGVNLRDLVAANGPLNISDTLSFALQITAALEHAWQRDVVHRDIKPSNILIDRHGVVKVVDMGLARLRVEEDKHDLTSSGATLGTFDYIAPEQARDPRNADARSDIYSLGCTIFFMLTGRPPFPEGTALQKLLQHQGDKAPDLRAVRPSVPRDLSRAVARMLAKRPEDRYEDPTVLHGALSALVQRLGITPQLPVVGAPSYPEDTPLRRHAPWIVAVVVLLVAWAAWPLVTPPTPTPQRFDTIVGSQQQTYELPNDRSDTRGPNE